MAHLGWVSPSLGHEDIYIFKTQSYTSVNMGAREGGYKSYNKRTSRNPNFPTSYFENKNKNKTKH